MRQEARGQAATCDGWSGWSQRVPHGPHDGCPREPDCLGKTNV